MMPTLMHAQTKPAKSFEEEAQQVLNRVRRAFAGLIEEVARSSGPGSSPIKATDLQRQLGIPTTLAWRVHRVARAENPFREVESIPGVTAVQRLVKAARRKSLSAGRLDEVTEAVAQFESLIRDHAGSRQTLNSMVASMSDDADDTIDLACRKTAFLTNSQIWGVQARTGLWSGIYHPGTHDRAIDYALLTGAADSKRLHSDVRPHSIRSVLGQVIQPEADERRKRLGPILLEKFSTQPLPIVSRELLEDGTEQIDVLPSTMGKNGATSYFVAEAAFDVPWSSDDPDDEFTVVHLGCMTPVETLIVDLLVYRDMFGDITPKAAVFDGRKGRVSVQELLSRRRLPLKVEAVRLGRGLDAMHSADLPRYPAMVEDVCGRLGWDASQFDVWRCRVEYPILSSVTAIWFPLPMKGNW